jgi:hypothetical protein
MRPRLLTLGFAALALLAAPARSSAESVTAAFVGDPNGSGNVSLGGTTINAAPIGPLYWSQTKPDGTPYNRPVNGNFPTTFASFCIELGNTAATQISPGVPYTFGVRADLTTAPTIGTQAKADAILELYGTHYNPAWANPSFGGSADSVAFQLALWELIYDGPGGSLTGGNFSVDPAVFPESSIAQGWVSGLTGNPGAFAANLPNMELVALVAPAAPDEAKLNTPTQDQLVLRAKAVPAPPAALLAGLGLIALIGRRRLWKA